MPTIMMSIAISKLSTMVMTRPGQGEANGIPRVMGIIVRMRRRRRIKGTPMKIMATRKLLRTATRANRTRMMITIDKKWKNHYWLLPIFPHCFR